MNYDADTDMERVLLSNLTAELDLLQSRYTNLTEERDELQRNLTDLLELHQVFQHGWVYIYGSLYYLSTTKKSWTESREDCQERGADLLIINSPEEQNIASHCQKDVWIGLTDEATEGEWKWVDGTPLNQSYWGGVEPNNAGGHEDCAEIRESGWNDERCNSRRQWICEKKPANPSE
ncbi:unnamed protein product [Ophioblennius macclurei]